MPASKKLKLCSVRELKNKHYSVGFVNNLFCHQSKVLHMKRIRSHDRKIPGIIVIFFGISFLFLQYNIAGGATLFQSPQEPLLTGAGNLIIQPGSSVNNQGSLVLLGDVTNNGTPSLGSGTVRFSGSVVQTINGMNTFQNADVDNSSGITVNGPVTVNGTLTLTNGLVAIGTNNLLLGPSASIGGIPGNTRMIVATVTGQLQKQFSGTESFTFPVGDNIATPEYSPVTLSFTSGSFAPGSYAGINLKNAPYPGYTDSYLKRYWSVTSSGITGFSCNAQFNYLAPADVVGTESDIYCIKAKPLPEIFYDPVNTALHQLTANGITSFGIYTGRKVARALTCSYIMLEGLYAGLGMMNKAQDGNGDHFQADTADVISVELHNSSDYSQIKYAANNVKLSIYGVAYVSVPPSFNENYYLTIRHRNSIETTTALPVDFGSSAIDYSFNQPSKAYGSNMGLEIDGTAVIYAGDENQDGIVDGGDLSDIENMATLAASGYIVQDVNGDGLVDGSDLSMTENNATLAVGVVTP
jgi:hypothetical protein